MTRLVHLKVATGILMRHPATYYPHAAEDPTAWPDIDIGACTSDDTDSVRRDELD